MRKGRRRGRGRRRGGEGGGGGEREEEGEREEKEGEREEEKEGRGRRCGIFKAVMECRQGKPLVECSTNGRTLRPCSEINATVGATDAGLYD